MPETTETIVANANKDALKSAYTQALTDLQAMIDDASMTNAEAVANIKTLATIQKKLLKFMERQING